MYPIYRKRIALKGFTLFELIISIALMAIIAGAVWGVFAAGVRPFYGQRTRAIETSEAGRALQMLADEIREATSITAAQQTSITFTVDSDGDGNNETVLYSWSGTAGDPLNRTYTPPAPGTPFTKAVVNSVSSLSFSYYNFDSTTALTFPVTLSQVKALLLDMTVTSGSESFQLRNRIKLRDF